MKHIIIFLMIACTAAVAHDIVPGSPQSQPIALVNGKIYTVSGNVIEKGTLVFADGKISALGEFVAIPDDARVIDLAGKHVYPGLIAAFSQVGLVEISAVRATRDFNETGSFNPNARAATAYNSDSEIIPTVRSNGITSLNISPTGGRISGLASLINSDGWTVEDAMLKENTGMLLDWPRMTVVNAWWMRTPADKQKEQISKSLAEMEDYFELAAAYNKARNANPKTTVDLRFEAMRPVMAGEMPLFVRADELKEIEAAIDFCRRHELKMILVSGRDVWKVPGLLKENNIPVILRQTHDLPARDDEPYDIAFRRPAILHEAGVQFCISKTNTADSWDIRNLPFHVGSAVAHGLDYDAALKSITLWPAQILGVADRVGSLETGKDATLIVSEGDILDMRTSKVTHMFISGREVDLDNMQKRLNEKYKVRYNQ